MKLLLIYNKFAGGKSAGKRESKVLEVLKNAGHDVEILYSEANRNIINKIEQLDLSPYEGFIIGGGDGTILEALNGYIRNKTTNKPTVGFIPVGTGNAFVRDLGIKTCEIEKAVDLISKNSPKPVDAALAKAGDETFYFFNIMGIGFVSDVSATAQKFKFLGNFAYTIGVFIEALRLKRQSATLIINGKKEILDYNFIEISNTRYTSNFLMAPSALFDDGYLDITILKHINLFRLFSSFPKILNGTHISMPEVSTYKTDHIIIQSEKTKIATPDGELLGTTPIEVKALKHAFKVFA